MHPNEERLRQLFRCLNEHDHQGMAACYDEQAVFSDIAFDLQGRTQIHAMWRMVCSGDIKATVQTVSATDQVGAVHIVDEYTLKATGNKVRNVIEGQFRFRDNLILEHRDTCDPLDWARQGFGRVAGGLIGRVAPLRRYLARRGLRKFIAESPG